MKKHALLSLFSVISISTLASGCRFGNHADEAKPLRNTNQKIEMFYNSPASFETKVRLNSISGPDAVVNTNTSAPLSLIPSTLVNTFSYPAFYFAVPDDTTYSPYFRDITDSYGFTTKLDPSGNGNIAYDGISQVFLLWQNESCLTQYEITQEGTFDRTKPDTITYPDGSTSAVAGKLSFTYNYTRVIDGDCAEDLTYLADCYLSGTHNGVACPGQAVSYSKNLFDLYKQSGVLNMNDVTKIKVLEHTVHYE